MRIRVVGAVALSVYLLALPSEAQPSKPLSAADMTSINEITDAYMAASLAKDFTTLAGLYVEDAILNPPNEAMVKGRAAIRAWAEKQPTPTVFVLKNLKVEGSGELAYVWGTYSITLTPPGAPGPITDTGKFIEIRRRERDGKWRIALDIFNSDLAAPK